MRHETLTGNVRLRQWKGKLVLQVQVKFLHTYLTGGCVDSEWVTTYRDATIEDITVMK